MKKVIKSRQLHRGLRHADDYLANIETEVKMARNMIRKHLADDLKRVRKNDKRNFN